MEDKLYFKVVRNNTLTGLFSCSPPSGCELEYFTDKWTAPTIPNSKIFVFESLEKAQDFIEFPIANNINHEIWTCKVEGVSVLEKMIHSYYGRFSAEEFWRNCLVDTVSVPKGTFGADKIMLVQKVYPGK